MYSLQRLHLIMRRLYMIVTRQDNIVYGYRCVIVVTRQYLYLSSFRRCYVNLYIWQMCHEIDKKFICKIPWCRYLRFPLKIYYPHLWLGILSHVSRTYRQCLVSMLRMKSNVLQYKGYSLLGSYSNSSHVFMRPKIPAAIINSGRHFPVRFTRRDKILISISWTAPAPLNADYNSPPDSAPLALLLPPPPPPPHTHRQYSRSINFTAAAQNTLVKWEGSFVWADILDVQSSSIAPLFCQSVRHSCIIWSWIGFQT